MPVNRALGLPIYTLIGLSRLFPGKHSSETGSKVIISMPRLPSGGSCEPGLSRPAKAWARIISQTYSMRAQRTSRPRLKPARSARDVSTTPHVEAIDVARTFEGSNERGLVELRGFEPLAS